MAILQTAALPLGYGAEYSLLNGSPRGVPCRLFPNPTRVSRGLVGHVRSIYFSPIRGRRTSPRGGLLALLARPPVRPLFDHSPDGQNCLRQPGPNLEPSFHAGLWAMFSPFISPPFGGEINGAGNGARTRHLRLGKAALYQMSYSRKWCLRVELNHRHGDFQSPALPTELPRQIWRPEGGSNP